MSAMRSQVCSKSPRRDVRRAHFQATDNGGKDEDRHKSHHLPLLLSANLASYPATNIFSTLSTDKTGAQFKDET